MCDISQINSRQNWLSNHSCSMNKSVVQCCALFDGKCLLSFLKGCFCLFVLCLLFCFVLFWRTSEFPSISILYALILRDGFQQRIAKALATIHDYSMCCLPTIVITRIMGRFILGIKCKWKAFRKSQTVMLH